MCTELGIIGESVDAFPRRLSPPKLSTAHPLLTSHQFVMVTTGIENTIATHSEQRKSFPSTFYHHSYSLQIRATELFRGEYG